MKPTTPSPIPDWILRWFNEPAYGLDDQDWDLILMEVNFLPLMIQYLESSDGVLDKKFTVVSALAEMLLKPRGENPEAHPVSEAIAGQIKDALKRNRDVALLATPHLSVTSEILILLLCGDGLPKEMAQWHAEIKRCEAALA
jgi:hypothetical protein